MIDRRRVLDRQAFLKEFGCEKYVKLTCATKIHNGVEIKTGLNIDPNPWFPYLKCFPGKIYFIKIKDILEWLCYNGNLMIYFRYVTLLEDSKICIEEDFKGIKFGTDKMILSERHNIRDMFNYKLTNDIPDSVYYASRMMTYDGRSYYFSDQSTPPQNYAQFLCTINKTYAICIELLNKKIIGYFDLPDECIDRYADKLLQNDVALGSVFDYIKNPTKEMCIKYANEISFDYKDINDFVNFINHNWELFESISDETKIEQLYNKLYLFYESDSSLRSLIITLICKLVRKYNELFKLVPEEYILDDDINTEIIRKNWRMIKYITYPTDIQCYYAISQSYEALGLIKEPLTEFIEFAISLDWKAILLIDPTKRTNNLWTLAILQSEDAIDALINN